jgi:hypothetical protein
MKARIRQVEAGLVPSAPSGVNTPGCGMECNEYESNANRPILKVRAQLP